MKLLLIRHAETEHNIAGLLAGVTDSALTNHGVLQAQRLGSYLANHHQFTHIFSSDLRRAYMTAKAIEDAQKSKHADVGDTTVVQLELLREQDFGSFECMPWSSQRSKITTDRLPRLGDAGFRPKETSEAMARRANIFLDEYILPQLAIDHEQEGIVALVSHGLILAVLWKSLLARFGPETVSLETEIGSKAGSRPLEYLPGWSNTGYVELHMVKTPVSVAELVPCSEDTPGPASNDRPAKLPGWRIVVQSVNRKDHLSNLKRTRGGVGSSTYDTRQKNLDGYFKKPRVAVKD